MINKSQFKELMQELMPNTELNSDGLPSAQTIAKPTVVRRFFFVCTAGKEFNSGMSFNTFDYKTTDGNYPTIAELVEFSKNKYVGQKGVMLISVSEIPATDWSVFVSAQ